jgi:3-oxoacyl-[acyl-carrier-protein] synthase-3
VKAVIRAIAAHLPERELTNRELAEQLGGEWTAEKMLEKTGIAARRVAGPDECASDLGVKAAQSLLDATAFPREQIDYLLFVTQTPDYFMPSTACLVQDRLGLPTSCGAIDIGQGCSGWVYGLSVAKSLIESEVVRNVLLVTADTASKYMNPRDRSVRTIFGDGAAATLLTADASAQEMVGPFVFGTDGRGVESIVIPAGGFRNPASDERRVAREGKDGIWRSEADIHMNGPEVFNFTLQSVPKAIRALLAKAGRTMDDVDLFIFHQANRFMLDRLRAKMEIPEDRFCIDLEWCGNTTSSSIPIALSRAVAAGRVQPGMRVMAVAFGVGYSWAAAMITAA